jgi:hypothetical protein
MGVIRRRSFDSPFEPDTAVLAGEDRTNCTVTVTVTIRVAVS